jgi:RNA polymerase sigma-70 factor (ECF subfamily)
MPGDVAEAGAAVPAAFDFDAVFRSEYARVARVIARVVRDPGRAEDLAVDTFWKLCRTPAAQGENAAAWLYRSAVRIALDELRRRARRAKYEQIVAMLRRSPPTPDELFSSAEDQGRVRTVLAAIPPRDAELLLLRNEGLSYDELATTVGVSSLSIGTLLRRARTAFQKEYLKRYGEQSFGQPR